jgi:hypothetical protein
MHQERFFLEIPPPQDLKALKKLIFKIMESHSQVLSLTADLQPRFVLNVENLGQNFTLSEHLKEEVIECAKSGGAMIILDLDKC